MVDNSGEVYIISKVNMVIIFSDYFNPLMPNGSTYHRGFKCDFKISFHFFNEIPPSKQNSPRWDAAFCFLPMSHKRDTRRI